MDLLEYSRVCIPESAAPSANSPSSFLDELSVEFDSFVDLSGSTLARANGAGTSIEVANKARMWVERMVDSSVTV